MYKPDSMLLTHLEDGGCKFGLANGMPQVKKFNIWEIIEFSLEFRKNTKNINNEEIRNKL